MLNQSKARTDGITLLCVGSMVFLLLGFALENGSSDAMADFGVVYFPARCLALHGDPYSPAAVSRVYGAHSQDPHWTDPKNREFVTRNEYPPTAFTLTTPLAMLPWVPAHILWIILTAAGLIVSAFLMWELCSGIAPVLSAVLIAFLLANCEALFVLGNPAGLAMSLCVIAVWCFLRDRLVVIGIVCMAASLALKAHDTGLIWLSLLLCGGIYRKRAVQTLGAVTVISLPSVVWVWLVSPHWMTELHANVAGFLVHGGTSDPGPASTGSHGLDMLVNLQAVFSVFRDDPRFYQPISLAVSGTLVLVWAVLTVRSRLSPERLTLSIAAASALSVLPFYHHSHDAKLILLTVPACIALVAQGGRIGRAAVVVTAIAFVCTGDLIWAIALALVNKIPSPTTWLGREILIVVQVFPASLALLCLGVFYLYVLGRDSRAVDLLEDELAPASR